MVYLTEEEITKINFRTIQVHGGNFVPPSNLIREGGLSYVVEIVQQEIFGEKVFKSISEICKQILRFDIEPWQVFLPWLYTLVDITSKGDMKVETKNPLIKAPTKVLCQDSLSNN